MSNELCFFIWRHSSFFIFNRMDRKTIELAGSLDASCISGLGTAMDADTIYTLDFSNVTAIGFSAVRTLINLHGSGHRFYIVNASDQVASFIDSTGASAFINVCRKPSQLDLTGMKHSGESFTAKTYFLDSETMAKVYEDFLPESVAIQDYLISRSVVMSGLDTPMASGLIRVGEHQYGILFERVQGKRSFARAISINPDSIEDYAIRFASMTRKLHEAECDTSVFPDRTAIFRDAVINTTQYTDAEKQQMLDFMDSVPRTTTCIHGDLHIGNVITNGTSDLWIDMGDFSYGNPLWDIAMLYFVCNCNPSEDMIMDMFHVGIPVMRHFWQLFARHYFGADTEEKQQQVHQMMRPFAAVQMTYLVYRSNKDLPFMAPTVRSILATMK